MTCVGISKAKDAPIGGPMDSRARFNLNPTYPWVQIFQEKFLILFIGGSIKKKCQRRMTYFAPFFHFFLACFAVSAESIDLRLSGTWWLNMMLLMK